MMSGDFQNDIKIIYVLPSHPLFRQLIYVRYPDFKKTLPFSQNIPLVLVSVHVR